MTTATQEYLQSLFGLAGQVAVVIGGTGVLGGALAAGLARAGARVMLAGRSLERGPQRVAELQQLGGEAACATVDVTSRDSMVALRDAVLQQWGRVDIVINGAGTNFAGPYLELADADWHRVLHTNLDGVHLGCQVFGQHFVQAGHGGPILNSASVTAHIPLSKVFAYAASKAAVVNLTQNVAREFAPHGIRVNALCPGFFPAEQNRKILDADRRRSVLEQTPLARFGEPEELVGAALLLLSARAGSFITGTALYVDGGFTAMRF